MLVSDRDLNFEVFEMDPGGTRQTIQPSKTQMMMTCGVATRFIPALHSTVVKGKVGWTHGTVNTQMRQEKQQNTFSIDE